MTIMTAIIMILAAIVIMVTCLLSIKEEITDGNIIIAALYAVLFLVMLIAICACAMAIRTSIIHHEDRYSSKEYHIETEITSRGDVSDTTYVITRK